MAAVLIGAVIVGISITVERRSADGLRARVEAAEQPTAGLAAEPAGAVRPWIEPTVEPSTVVEVPDPAQIENDRRDRCRLDRETMAAVAVAYVTQTRNLPDDPGVVETTWLRDVPGGWNDAWDFHVDGAGLTVVPAEGGDCDM